MNTSFTALVLFLPLSVLAQFSLDWSAVTAGSATSTGGVYTLSATVGQPVAGRITGGEFAVEAGFWSVIRLVQTEGAPVLAIQRTATNTVVLSWSKTEVPWKVEEVPDASAAQWTGVGAEPQLVGDRYQLVIPLTEGNRFFRLKKP